MEEGTKNISDLTLALFFTTQGKSLVGWDLSGILRREIKPYQHIAKYVKKIYIFTYGNENDRKYQSLFPDNVVIVPKASHLPVFLYSFLLPVIHRNILREVDILKTNQMDGSWAAVIAKRLYKKRLLVRCGYEWLQFIERARRSWFKRMFARHMESYAYHNADIIVQTSQESAEFVKNRFAISKEKIQVIPNYIDTELFAPAHTTPEDGTIVYVGRLEQQKNLHSLIEGLVGLPVRLTIIGEGKLREELKLLAQEKRVNIVWKGMVPQKELPAELCRHSFFILPSLYEGSPKSLLEAMACGLPCIATDVSGNREIIDDHANGILCDITAESITGAVKELLQNHSLRKVIGEGAREKIVANYSFNRFLEQELTIYKTL